MNPTDEICLRSAAEKRLDETWSLMDMFWEYKKMSIDQQSKFLEENPKFKEFIKLKDIKNAFMDKEIELAKIQRDAEFEKTRRLSFISIFISINVLIVNLTILLKTIMR